jgi:predicted RNase H-like HicB family nuclease
MKLDYTYWSDDGWLLGYLNDYPGHLTQGKNLPELEEMLLDLYEIFKKDEENAKARAAVEKKTGTLTVAV